MNDGWQIWTGEEPQQGLGVNKRMKTLGRERGSAEKQKPGPQGLRWKKASFALLVFTLKDSEESLVSLDKFHIGWNF